MRHRKAGRQLRRTSEQKLALMRGLATSLIEHEKVETTEAKAKELRPFVEKLISKAKTGTLHSRRLAGRHIQKREAADKLLLGRGEVPVLDQRDRPVVASAGHAQRGAGTAGGVGPGEHPRGCAGTARLSGCSR